MRVCVGVMMWATDMRASRFESGLAGTGAVSVDHEYRRGVTDGGGDGEAGGGVAVFRRATTRYIGLARPGSGVQDKINVH